MLTTVQDGGRYGFQRFGMPVSGTMDRWSHQMANLLVGNRPDDACLEAMMTGPEIIFSAALSVAICGADMTPLLNGLSVPMWRTLRVKSGDQLSFSELKAGCRTYLAIEGGIDVPRVMGSRSTCLRTRLGGYLGRPLKAGDVLTAFPDTSNKIHIRTVPEEFIPDFLHDQVIRIIPGPEVHRFTFAGIKNFLTGTYEITNHSDRMGYRLAGPEIAFSGKTTDIVSAGISPGTIQVTTNGQPIVLMADRQTTGGYCRIANVASADLPLVAQMKPGETIRFREISLNEAQELVREQQRIIGILMQGCW